MTTTPTTFTIDCRTCPVRGRLCGDCFVPVLGRAWLQDPAPRPVDAPHPAGLSPAPEGEPPTRGLALDSDELAAVSAFVRAGLVHPEEAERARAELTGARSAAG